MKRRFKYYIVKFFYYFYRIIDISIWIILKNNPKKNFSFLLEHKFSNIKIKIPSKLVNYIENYITKFDYKISFYRTKTSSCLSRSITSRLILDLIGIKSKLRIGINKFQNGDKVPHAWLINENNGKEYTMGLDKKSTFIKEF